MLIGLAEQFEDREGVDLDSPLRVHLSGCNASCAQPQIADIGFQGSKTRKDGEVVEKFIGLTQGNEIEAALG